MKVIAEKVIGKDLKAGDLFSTADQTYWSNIDFNQSIGERVFIRTNTSCPKSTENEKIYKISINKEGVKK